MAALRTSMATKRVFAAAAAGPLRSPLTVRTLATTSRLQEDKSASLADIFKIRPEAPDEGGKRPNKTPQESGEPQDASNKQAVSERVANSASSIRRTRPKQSMAAQLDNSSRPLNREKATSVLSAQVSETSAQPSQRPRESKRLLRSSDQTGAASEVATPSLPASSRATVASDPAAPSTSFDPSQIPDETDLADTDDGASFELPQCLMPTLRLPRTHGHHVATLHLRCYTSDVHEMDRFADFSHKAAYAIGIPIGSYVKLPTRTSLWTVLKGPFVHKKAQENFWRRTHSRSFKLFDANAEVVDRWLMFLRIHAAPGIHMKAQLFRRYAPGVGSRMQDEFESKQLTISQRVGTTLDAQEQATPAQTADQIKGIADGIVNEELAKINAEAASEASTSQ